MTATTTKRPKPPTAPVPRLTLTRAEAAASLGISTDALDDHVVPEIRVIRKGGLLLIPVVELEKWIQREAARDLPSRNP